MERSADMDIAFKQAAPLIHDTVAGLLQDEKKGELLDAPSGQGLLSSRFSGMGFSVSACDLNAEGFKVDGVECRKADLNDDLPYPDGSFEYVVCAEGIEHIKNSYHLIGEFGRILKKGGKLIITTPNILSIFSRLRYFLIGYYDFSGGRYSAEHINLMGFPDLYRILNGKDFKLEQVATNRNVISTRRMPMRMLLWVLAVLARIATRLKVKDGFMRDHLVSNDVLLGECLIIKATKN